MSRKLCVSILPVSTGGAMRGLATMNTAGDRPAAAREKLAKEVALSPEERSEALRRHLRENPLFKKP